MADILDKWFEFLDTRVFDNLSSPLLMPQHLSLDKRGMWDAYLSGPGNNVFPACVVSGHPVIRNKASTRAIVELCSFDY